MRQSDDATERSRSAPTDATANTIEGGRAYMADTARRLAHYCTHSQSRHRVVAYLCGILGEAERKNSWPVTEVCGESTPDGFQYLLSRAEWGTDAVCDEWRTYSRHHPRRPTACWSSARPGRSTKAATRPGSPGNKAARLGK